jgi:hypothetical protein
MVGASVLDNGLCQIDRDESMVAMDELLRLPTSKRLWHQIPTESQEESIRSDEADDVLGGPEG